MAGFYLRRVAPNFANPGMSTTPTAGAGSAAPRGQVLQPQQQTGELSRPPCDMEK